MGRDLYGCSLASVREVVQAAPIAALPTTPSCLRGVMPLRERAIPVVDLRVKFGEPVAALTRWSCVLVLELKSEGAPLTLGILADRVEQVLDLDDGALQPTPELGMKVRVEFVAGLARTGGVLVPLLDLDRLLSSAELAAAAQAETASPTPSPTPVEER